MKRLTTILGTGCKWILALVMLTAAISKIGDIQEFADFIARLPFPLLREHSLSFAKLTIAIELTLAISLISSDDCTLTCIIAGVLLLGFTIFQFMLPKLMGDAAICPCIKTRLLSDLDASLTFRVLRNVVLLLCAIVACILSPSFRRRRMTVES